MQTETANEDPIDSENEPLDEQVAALVDTAVTALESAGAEQTSVEAFEAAGEEVVETLEEATIVVENGDDTDRNDDDDDDQDAVENELSDDSEADLDRLRQIVFGHIENDKTFRNDIENRLETLEDRPPGNQEGDGENADAGPRIEPQTHLEHLARLPSRVTEDESPNVRRALFVARDADQYTTRVRAGRIIKWSELGKVLRAGTDCEGRGQTVARVMEFLDRFGEDTVRIVDKERHEKMVCFDDEAVRRLSRLAGTADAGTGTDGSGRTHGVVSGETE